MFNQDPLLDNRPKFGLGGLTQESIFHGFFLVRKSLIQGVFSFLEVPLLKVAVRFFTSLREITGKREETLEFAREEKVTVDKVLQALSKKYGNQFVDYVYDTEANQVKGFLQFIINGTSSSSLNGLQTELRDGDILAILPPVGGG